jgi:hypothetical protein
MTKNTQTILGVLVVGVVGYLAYKKFYATPKVSKVGGDMKVEEEKSFTGDDQFFNLASANAPTKAKYIAGGYVSPSMQHPNGQTWISYGGVGASGYWHDGYIAQGTVVTNPTFK